MEGNNKNIRISDEAHRWLARVSGATRESKAAYASRLIKVGAEADWNRLVAEIAAEKRRK